MKTIVHAYSFYINEKEGAAGYAELRERLKASGVRCHESHGGSSHYMPALDGVVVTLETEHLFDNQWNTSPVGESKTGYRLFDWALDYNPYGNPNLKRGHYLEMTEEMRAARLDRHACGYCGHQCSAADATAFCNNCLDSEYLKSSELHLTRMLPVAGSFNAKRAPLTEAEAAARLPLYKSAQMHGSTERGKARIAKKRASVIAERDKTVANANAKHDGLLWLMDRGIAHDPIYYDHTSRFCFGWRGDGVDAALKPELAEALKEFPFPYDIK